MFEIFINFKTEKEPKMKFFDFGEFQINGQMTSYEKTSFTCFWAFYIALRKYLNHK